jgi:hypothetical protein
VPDLHGRWKRRSTATRKEEEEEEEVDTNTMPGHSNI